MAAADTLSDSMRPGQGNLHGQLAPLAHQPAQAPALRPEHQRRWARTAIRQVPQAAWGAGVEGDGPHAGGGQGGQGGRDAGHDRDGEVLGGPGGRLQRRRA